MSKPRNLPANLVLIEFEPAVLKEWPTGLQIEYRVFNPFLERLEKVRIRYEKVRKRLGSDAQTRKHAKRLCDAITQKLETGWNPHTENINAKTFHTLEAAFKVYLTEKEKDLKNGIFREDSMRTYVSQISMLKEWLLMKKMDKTQVIKFTKELAGQYMDYVYLKKNISSRTYNNYIRTLRTLWAWLIEKNYCIENPFSKLKVKQEVEKERVIIPVEWTENIMKYFAENEPRMIIICELVYNSFMRPSEICKTQIGEIHFSKNGILLPGTKTKNKKKRWCLLPPELLLRLVDLNLDRYPSEMYLFSTSLLPGTKMLNTRDLDKYWNRMRKAISLPKEMQLYSYRDTGITDMKNDGHNNYFISSITGHLNSQEIETYTHEPNSEALDFVVSKMKCLPIPKK